MNSVNAVMPNRLLPKIFKYCQVKNFVIGVMSIGMLLRIFELMIACRFCKWSDVKQTVAKNILYIVDMIICKCSDVKQTAANNFGIL